MKKEDSLNIIIDQECVVCFEKLVNKTHIEDEDCLQRYEDRFECITCKSMVCFGCLVSMPDVENGKQLDSYATFHSGYDIFITMDMEYTGVITCPVCRIKDYRIHITHDIRGVLPEEILRDIKKNIK
jgi:hypothetical protein